MLRGLNMKVFIDFGHIFTHFLGFFETGRDSFGSDLNPETPPNKSIDNYSVGRV